MIKNRHRAIIQYLANAPMTIEQLCQELDASPATIRRDLSKLEESGSIIRVKGGAILNRLTEDGKEKEAQTAPDPFEHEKKRIAEAAVKLVNEKDTIFIDSGSTNGYISDRLLDLTNITIVTNSLEIAYKFIHRKDISVMICGGSLGDVNPASIVGPMAEKIIALYRATLCFLGTSGIDMKQGITDPYLSSARIKEAMIEHASKVVLVSDRSKFRVVNPVFVCPLHKINHVITDDQAPIEDIHALMSRGISVTLV